MAERVIDYDRGVIIKVVPSLGLDIFMYRDQPGVYLNAYGQPVSLELAAQAGFNVAKHTQQRTKQRLIDEFRRKLDADMKAELEATDKVVVLEREGFSLVAIAEDRHFIESPDGQNLTPGRYLTREEGEALFNQVVPSPEPAPEPELPVPVTGGPGPGVGDQPGPAPRRQPK